MLDVLDSSGMIATLVTGILPAPAWAVHGMEGWSDPAQMGVFAGSQLETIIAEMTAVRKVCHVSRKALLCLVQVNL